MVDKANAALLAQIEASEGAAVEVVGVCGMGAKPKPAVKYYGGKSPTLAEWILGYFPPEHTYSIFVEGFGGAAGLITRKKPHGIEIYNDLEDAMTTLFEVLQDPSMCAELERRLRLTPNARTIWQHAYKGYRAETDPIKKACMVFITLNQSMSGRLENDGFAFGGPLHDPSCADQWQRALNNIPLISKRFRRVTIEHQDIYRLIEQWDSPETLFYFDPPYPRSTRYRGTKAGHENTYTCEMSEADHARFAERLLTLKGQAVLSGYDTAHYAPLSPEAGWQKHSKNAKARSMVRTVGNGLKGNHVDDDRLECVWVKRHTNYTLWQEQSA